MIPSSEFDADAVGRATACPAAEAPLRDDRVTMPCPSCGQDFRPTGRQRFCSAACRQATWRRRQATPLPEPQPRQFPRLATVYECPACETRLLGRQRCPDCGVFCRRVGPGGLCPQCEEPVALADLLNPEKGGAA
jgi:hypothetical protein